MKKTQSVYTFAKRFRQEDIIIEELELLVRKPDAKELAFNYPSLDYTVVYILYYAQVGCIAQQALVELLEGKWRF